MIEASYPAKLENLDSMIKFITDLAEKSGFTAQHISQIHLAAEEILVNAISYAYSGKNGSVEISCGIGSDDKLLIEIKDSGVPFNPLEKPDPDITLPLEQRKIGGLGIFMTKKIMDSVSYRRENNKNIVTLKKSK